MTYFYEPSRGHGLPHDPWLAIVAPRPIGWISSLTPEGVRNLAPYSFFNAFNSRPPIVGFSSVGWKHSARNAKETGEFVANFVSRKLKDQMNLSSTPQDTDEFEHAGLEAAPSTLVRPPRVKDAPAALECRTLDVIQLRDLQDRKLDTWLVLGQVVGVHIREEFLQDGAFDTHKAEPIMRAGYKSAYAAMGEMFRMERP